MIVMYCNSLPRIQDRVAKSKVQRIVDGPYPEELIQHLLEHIHVLNYLYPPHFYFMVNFNNYLYVERKHDVAHITIDQESPHRKLKF